jgi:hypothetical protein
MDKCPQTDPEQFDWLASQVSNLVQRAFRAGHSDRRDYDASERIETLA